MGTATRFELENGTVDHPCARRQPGLRESMRIDFFAIPSRWQRILHWFRKTACRCRGHQWQRAPEKLSRVSRIDYAEQSITYDTINVTKRSCRRCGEVG